MRKALADYTANIDGAGVTDPTVDKDELITRILETIGKTKAFLSEKGFELQSLIEASDFQKLSCLQDAANAVCGSIEDKKKFTTYASEIIRLMKYTDRGDISGESRREFEAVAAIYAELQKKRRHVDTTELSVEINMIISQYVEIEQKQPDSDNGTARYDISEIDFDLLRKEFAKVRNKNLVMKDLEDVIQQKLDKMLFTNPNRMDYYERYHL